jgi:ribosome-associated toxin RatA of RatAB toxin-antitoxin module
MSSDATTTAAPATPPRRFKKRWIAWTLLALVLLFFAGAYIRGTWADTEPRDPKNASEGCIAQLLLLPDGRKVVRCAEVVDAPAARVWVLLTDYDKFSGVFPYVRELKAEKEADGRHHLTGTVHSQIYGDWPLEVTMTHEEPAGAGEYRASWDSPGGNIRVNRGHWTVTPLDEKRCRVAYVIDLEVNSCPTWLLRNIVLNRVTKIVGAVGQHLPNPS